MNNIFRFGLIAFTMTAGAAAHANTDDAKACAAKLDAAAQLVFNETLVDLAPNWDIKAALTTRTKALVQAGTLDRSIARPAAVAAMDCLALAG